MPVEEEIGFEWGEDCQEDEPKGLRRRRGKICTNYLSCSVNGELVSVGDDVVIDLTRNEEAIGRIKKLYHVHVVEEYQHRAQIHWYFKSKEIDSQVLGQIGRVLSEEYELFWPVDTENCVVSGSTEVIDAETILKKCEVDVITSKASKKHKVVKGKYFVRFGFLPDHSIVSQAELLRSLSQDKEKASGLNDVKNKGSTNDEVVTARQSAVPKRKASKSIPDESGIENKYKRFLNDSSKNFETDEVVNLVTDHNEVFKDDQSESSCFTEDSHSTGQSSRRKSSRVQKATPVSKKDNVKLAIGLTELTKTKEKNKARVTKRNDSDFTEREDENGVENNDVDNISRNRHVRGNEQEKCRNKQGKKNNEKEIQENKSNNTPRTRRNKESKSKNHKSQKALQKTEKESRASLSSSQAKKTSKPSSPQKRRLNNSSNIQQNGRSTPTAETPTKAAKMIGKDSKKKGGNIIEDECDGPEKKDDNDSDYKCEDTSEEDDDDETEGEEEDEIESADDESDDWSSPPPIKRSNKKQSVKTPRKTPAKSPGKTPKSHSRKRPLSATPCIPVRANSCKTPATPLQKARASLHVSAVPTSLPCREQQFDDICSFIEGKLSEETGGCMYISGVPGTGKTATVHEVMRLLEENKNNGELSDFTFYEINGMKVTQPNQVYVLVYKFLTGEKVTADHASSLLDKYFSNSSNRKEHIILLVDELDQLWTRKQDVMYHLFDWPTRRRSKLIIIAIANTMDLPERMMINRVSSRLGLTRMTFQPYTYLQLQEIVTSRIKELEAFEPDAVQLVARKVAALSGDARRCLDICRRAVEIAEQEACNAKKKKAFVGMPHVEKSLNEMFSSPKIIAMKNLSVMEGYFLKAVLAEFRRTGLEEATFSGVYSQLLALCRLEGMSSPSPSLSSSIGCRLGATRLLLVDHGKCDLQQRIRLNVNKDDILFALKTAKKE